jgi:hypothetical protein
MGRIWFLPSFARQRIKGIEMFAKIEPKGAPPVPCSNCGAFIMGKPFVLEVKIGGKPVETKSDLCQPCYNKMKDL